MQINIDKSTDIHYPNCKVIDIYGDNYAGITNCCREASRGIIIKDGNILLSHEKNIGQWMTPGGGFEANETPEECCVREVAEETGYVVEPKACFLILNEYYEDWKYISYYFECIVTGTTERKPTSRETKVGACPEWVDFDYIKDVFSHHQDYAESNEERRGIYLREYLALGEFCVGVREVDSERFDALTFVLKKRIMTIQQNHIPECVSVIKRAFQTVADEFGFTAENAPRFTAFAMSEERLLWQFANEKRPMFAYFDGDKIVGYYSLTLPQNGVCELNNLAVLPEYRHNGIGKTLLLHAFDEARKMSCTQMKIGIVEENIVLRSWYESFGFVHVGTEKFDFFPFTCGYMKVEL